MDRLRYLVDEICAGIEVYFTGRRGQQYANTAFILCDDYTELASKLFLLTDDRAWSDQTGGGRFKNYHQVLTDVASVFATKRVADAPRVCKLHAAMDQRRRMRNGFFHSTNLLGMSVTARVCVEAFCDLMEYGAILFPDAWADCVRAARNLSTLDVLLRLERLGFSDPRITREVDAVFGTWPRLSTRPSRLGSQVAEHPEDIHCRLCIANGGADIHDKLEGILERYEV